MRLAGGPSSAFWGAGRLFCVLDPRVTPVGATDADSEVFLAITMLENRRMMLVERRRIRGKNANKQT